MAALREAYIYNTIAIFTVSSPIWYHINLTVFLLPFNSCLMFSGGASAVKESGHFEVRKSSSQVTHMHFFLKKVDDLFLVVALKTQAVNAVSPSK